MDKGWLLVHVVCDDARILCDDRRAPQLLHSTAAQPLCILVAGPMLGSGHAVCGPMDARSAFTSSVITPGSSAMFGTRPSSCTARTRCWGMPAACFCTRATCAGGRAQLGHVVRDHGQILCDGGRAARLLDSTRTLPGRACSEVPQPSGVWVGSSPFQQHSQLVLGASPLITPSRQPIPAWKAWPRGDAGSRCRPSTGSWVQHARRASMQGASSSRCRPSECSMQSV